MTNWIIIQKLQILIAASTQPYSVNNKDVHILTLCYILLSLFLDLLFQQKFPSFPIFYNRISSLHGRTSFTCRGEKQHFEDGYLKVEVLYLRKSFKGPQPKMHNGATLKGTPILMRLS